MRISLFRLKEWFVPVAFLVIALGMFLRLHEIFRGDLIFYDEGYYFNFDQRYFQTVVTQNPPQGLREWLWALNVDWRISLGTGKPVWLFICYLQNFFGEGENWFVPKVISAIFGCLTLGLTFLFARWYFGDKKTALLAAAILAVLPSHVFYSRLGLQEAMSTFCFLATFYCYFVPRQFGKRTFLSGIFGIFTYLTNYRMIVLPLLMGLAELYWSFSRWQRPDLRKYVWWSVTFLTLLTLIAIADGGRHMRVVLSWMLHQADMAQTEAFDGRNILSYPYFTFRLESILLGLSFWSGIYLLWKKKWECLLPFILVLAQMMLFSLAQDKAARYICVVLPFLSMATAVNITVVSRNSRWLRLQWIVTCALVLMFLTLIEKSWTISRFQSAYRPAMEFIKDKDPQTRVLTSQKWIMNLYTKHPANVRDLPQHFEQLIAYSARGYSFFAVDPQVYISWTQDKKKFSLPLADYLESVPRLVRPVAVFDHLGTLAMERFVFEHNENLVRSISFLDKAGPQAAQIRIYSTSEFVNAVGTLLKKKTLKKGNDGP